MRYLVDTDWIIDGLADQRPVLATLSRLSNDGLAVSTITLCEVFEGAHVFADPNVEIARYHQFLSGYTIIPVTVAIATRCAEVRAGLRRHGNLIPDFDLLIAATALEHQLTLVTRNVQHFERIPELRLYSEK